MVLGGQGGWRGQGRVRRKVFIEFSMIFIKFSKIFIDFIDFLWLWEAREAGEARGESRGGFSLDFLFLTIFIDFC